MINSISQIDFNQLKDISKLDTCLITDIDNLSDQEYKLFIPKTKVYNTNAHVIYKSNDIKCDFKYICIYVNDHHLLEFLTCAFSTIDCILRNNNHDVNIFIYIKTLKLRKGSV